MNFGPRSILIIVAVVLFLLDAFGVNLGEVDTLPVALAVFAAAFLVGDDGGRGLGFRR